MKIKTLLTIALLAIGWSSAMADDTDISSCENVVYIQSGSIISMENDGSAIIPINMKNSIDATGYQFKLFLPDGMTASDVTIANSKARKADNVSFNFKEQSDGSIMVVTYTTDDVSFSGNDGEVATLTINSAQAKDYTFTISDVVMTYHGPTVKPINVTSTITVKDNTYTEGYSISVAPLKADAGQEYDEDITSGDNLVAVFKMANAAELSKVEFDLELPEGVAVGQYSYVVKKQTLYADDIYYGGSYYSEEDFPEIEDGHISAELTINATEDAVPFIQLPLTTETSMTAGVYPIVLRNIVMTDKDGEAVNVNPTVSTYIKIGTPTTNSDLALEGAVSADVTESLADDASISTLDMSKVTSIDGTLTLVDGRGFVAPAKTLTVDKVAYLRSMTNSWGTICLPFDVESDASVQFYELAGVSDTKMSFSPVASVKAGTPAVFKLQSGSDASLSAGDVTISAGDNTWSTTISGNSWTMNGTMTATTLDPSTVNNDIYYIAEDKFWYGNQTFSVPAFRGWFETPKSAGAKVVAFDIADSSESTATTIKYVENADGTVDAVFDLSGRRLSAPQNGINIINGKKIVTK